MAEGLILKDVQSGHVRGIAPLSPEHSLKYNMGPNSFQDVIKFCKVPKRGEPSVENEASLKCKAGASVLFVLFGKCDLSRLLSLYSSYFCKAIVCRLLNLEYSAAV